MIKNTVGFVWIQISASGLYLSYPKRFLFIGNCVRYKVWAEVIVETGIKSQVRFSLSVSLMLHLSICIYIYACIRLCLSCPQCQILDPAWSLAVAGEQQKPVRKGWRVTHLSYSLAGKWRGRGIQSLPSTGEGEGNSSLPLKKKRSCCIFNHGFRSWHFFCARWKMTISL